MLDVRSKRGSPHNGFDTTAVTGVINDTGLRQMSWEGKLVGTAGFESTTEKAISACYCAVRIYLYPQKYPQILRDDPSRAPALVSHRCASPSTGTYSSLSLYPSY